MNRLALVDHLDHFRWRVLQDALLEATAEHWERRAHHFEWARPTCIDDPCPCPPPRHGTTHGTESTPATRLAKHGDLTAIAEACRNQATFLRRYGFDAEAQQLIAQALANRDECAA